ncbi:MAG: alpha/beta hydrolase fold family protein [Panacagrimonas sp.]|nr:alpha/beta hydrolase [Panacagrimonas sp.]MCC2659032.1 alpha/beta hydrolase fold family protein [Panacagrimonas sp.]
MNSDQFHAARRYVETPSGRIAYVEQGSGPVALFVHGVFMNGFLWRHVMQGIADMRRCIAPDLMSMGHTEIAQEQDISFPAQARMIAEFLDALGLDRVDMVANDSGGGIAQIFAANHPRRLRTLTLTNCDTHDHWPPENALPFAEAARAGLLDAAICQYVENPASARVATGIGIGTAYADPSRVSNETILTYLQPLVSSERRRADINRFWNVMDNAQTASIEPQLRQLQVPTLLVWGTADIFFPLSDALWLQRTIPGVKRLIEVPGQKLFFPEEKPEALVEPMRKFWAEFGRHM